MQSVSITVDRELCQTYYSVQPIQQIVDITCGQILSGRIVRFTKPVAYITFCELQIWVCISGYYGRECNKSCGQCRNGNTTCDKATGICPSGCQNGWALPYCDRECTAGKYGFNCNSTCGMCFNGTSACDPITGTCFFGCEGTYQPPWCHEEFKVKTNLNATALACGLSAGIVFIIAIAIFIILFRRRQQRSKKTSEADTSKNVERHSGSVKPHRNTLNISAVLFKGVNSKPHGKKRTSSVQSQQECPTENAYTCINDKEHITKAEVTSTNESWINDAHLLYGNIMQPNDLKSMSLSHFDQSQTQSFEAICQATSDAEVNNAVIVRLAPTPSVYENVQAASRSRTHVGDIEASDKVKSPQPVLLANNSDINMFEENDTNIGDESEIYRNEDIYSSYNPDYPALHFDSLQRSLLTSLASGQLSKQFMNLPTGMKHPYNEGRKPSNMKKNRFKAIFPYDHNRVILNRGDDDTKADYINASYIKGFQRKKAYIATQGPRPHTINDMWWMVWQDNVTHIVMLTNLKEDGKDKCEEYWPAPLATQAYGPIQVSCLNVDPRADFVIRSFTLQFKGNTLLRHVEQYQYVSWPDHGVPRATSLVNLWRYVKARAILQVPLLVHCSAGVGRTGTYIALDIAMDTAIRRHEVNVEKIVTELREERSMMVQAEAQYKFLYEVILEAYTSRKSRLTLEQFSASFLASIDVHEPNQFIDKEFKMLQHMGRFQPKPKYAMATLEENINKIRNVHNLPVISVPEGHNNDAAATARHACRFVAID